MNATPVLDKTEAKPSNERADLTLTRTAKDPSLVHFTTTTRQSNFLPPVATRKGARVERACASRMLLPL